LALSSFDDSADLIGYAGVLIQESSPEVPNDIPIVHGCVGIDQLRAGDIVGLRSTGQIRTLYRSTSDFNVLFATDHCNSLCLMCSQPPRNVNESGIMAEHRRFLRLLPHGMPELGITGGEPTLLGDGFLEIIQLCKDLHPKTPLHVLTNGRLFYYGSLARKLSEIQHPDLMLGIPVYSDIDSQHDYVVQAQGAFEETLIGLHNLGRYGVRVEIRVVLHHDTYKRLMPLAEFLYRNLPFASHIAFMGMESMGFAVPNLEKLWMDPADYQGQLRDATLFLAQRGMRVSIYNHQLCVMPRELWPYCRKSISDWKNVTTVVGSSRLR
jgi:His-Xaa-Ser system radical SAM maturase HxsC